MTDWYISLKKGLYVFLMGGIVATIDYLTQFTGGHSLEALYVAAGIAALRIIQDAIKHWDE